MTKIAGSGSTPKCHGSATLLVTELKTLLYSFKIIIVWYCTYFPAQITVNILVCFAVFSQELNGIFKCSVRLWLYRYVLSTERYRYRYCFYYTRVQYMLVLARLLCSLLLLSDSGRYVRGRFALPILPII
jgi:hypothetical protein